MAGQPTPGSPEEAFRKGLACLELRSYKEAASCFQSAIDREREAGAQSLRPRYVSHLGLALTMAHGRTVEALTLCEQAVRREFFDADLYCNLGIAYLRHRRRGEAFRAFRKGLGLNPAHRRILAEMERYEPRGGPVFASLPRTHVVNRMAGCLRSRFRALFHADSASRA